VIFRHHAFRLVGGNERHAPLDQKCLERIVRAIELHAETDERERLLRLLQPRHDGLDLSRRGSRDDALRIEPAAFRLFGNRDVGRQIEVHRPGHRRLCDCEAFAHLVESAFGRDVGRPLHERAHHLRLVDDLVRVDALERSRDLARKHGDCGAIEQRLRYRGRRVGDPRAESRDEHTRLTGELKYRVRHHARAEFLLGQHELDADLAERLEQLEHLTTRNAEGVSDPLFLERSSNDFSGFGHG
jgi:hypothetical protein